MAKDELIFESDREAEKARIRSTVTLIACLLAVVAAVVILALIVRGSRTVMETAEGSTPYPVSWGVDKDGQLKLRIDTSATPGGVWEFREPSSILTIEKDKKQPKDGTAFTISASGVGRSDLDLDLYDQSGNAVYRMDLLVDSLANGEGYDLSLLSWSGYQIQDQVNGPQEGRYTYVCQPEDGGGLSVIVMSLGGEASQEDSAAEQTEPGTFVYDGKEYPIDPSWPKGRISVEEGEIYIYLEGTDEKVPLFDIVSTGAVDEDAKVKSEGDYTEPEERPEGPEPVIYDFPSDWIIETSSEGTARDGGVFSDRGFCEAFILPGNEPGAAEIKISSETAAVQIVLGVELTEGGRLMIRSHEIIQ